MKRIVFFLLAAVVLGSFTLSDKGAVNIEIKKGGMQINTVWITPEWKLPAFASALGKESRSKDGVNETYTYDIKGIVLFEPIENTMLTGKVSEMQVYYTAADTFDTSPKGFFKGSIKVDKLNVDATLTPDLMRKKLSDWKESAAYMDHTYRMSSKGIYIYFQFSQDEKSLVKLSIGKDKAK